jgi:hypothetical protein
VVRIGFDQAQQSDDHFKLIAGQEWRLLPVRNSALLERQRQSRFRAMELAGLEPATSWVRSRRSPN